MIDARLKGLLPSSTCRMLLHSAMLQIGLAFVQYQLKRDEPLFHLTHAGPFISQLIKGQPKGVQLLVLDLGACTRPIQQRSAVVLSANAVMVCWHVLQIASPPLLHYKGKR